MLKSETAEDVVLDVVKYAALLPSDLADTSILIPEEGIFDLRVTLSGKSGPGAAASTGPAGLISTTSVSSAPPPELSPPLLLQLFNVAIDNRHNKSKKLILFILNRLIVFIVLILYRITNNDYASKDMAGFSINVCVQVKVYRTYKFSNSSEEWKFSCAGFSTRVQID